MLRITSLASMSPRHRQGQRNNEEHCHKVASVGMKGASDVKFKTSRLKEKLVVSDTLSNLNSTGKGCLTTCGDVELNPGPGR